MREWDEYTDGVTLDEEQERHLEGKRAVGTTVRAAAGRQLRGLHVLFMGERATVSTRSGYVYLGVESRDRASATSAMLTTGQAYELGRDLMAYADEARCERSADKGVIVPGTRAEEDADA